MTDEFVDIDVVRILQSTDKAVLVDYDETETWIPKSQIDNIVEVEKYLAATKPHDRQSPEEDSVPSVTISRWLAAKSGWADED